MRLKSIRRNLHNVVRLRQIVQVLVRYGFGYVVDQLHIERNVVGRRLLGTISDLEFFDMPVPVRLRKVLEELGPSFVKLGQILSTRPDALPSEYIRELEKLQDRVPAFRFQLAAGVITSELKHPIDALFSSFSHVPRACASLAQVYDATTRDGREVIVKVQRPGIERTIAGDIDILYQLANLARRYFETRLVDPVELVDEFRFVVTKELDFINEAFNVEKFRREFAGDGTVLIPEVYHGLTSRRILTMERVDGIKITDIGGLVKAGVDPKRVARNLSNAVLRQIFRYGFFHADPHPGNILAGGGDRVIFLDFGMVGRIRGQMKRHLVDALVAFINRDVPGIRESFLAIGSIRGEVDVCRLDADLEDLVDRYYGLPLRDLNIGQVLLDLIRLISAHRVRLPTDLFLLSKALVTLNGIAQKLDPGFNLVAESRPFAEEIQRERYSPRAVLQDVSRFSRSFWRFLRLLPNDLVSIINKVKRGTLKIELEHRGLDLLTSELDRVSNRISFSLVVSALIVGSSIVINVDVGPTYLGVPVLGLIGFVVAAVMGIWLVIVILRSGHF